MKFELSNSKTVRSQYPADNKIGQTLNIIISHVILFFRFFYNVWCKKPNLKRIWNIITISITLKVPIFFSVKKYNIKHRQYLAQH